MHSLWNHAFQRNTLLLMLSLGLIGGVGLVHFGFTVGVLWCLSMFVIGLSLLQMLNLHLIVAAVTAGLWFKSRIKSATITDKELVEQ